MDLDRRLSAVMVLAALLSVADAHAQDGEARCKEVLTALRSACATPPPAAAPAAGADPGPAAALVIPHGLDICATFVDALPATCDTLATVLEGIISGAGDASSDQIEAVVEQTKAEGAMVVQPERRAATNKSGAAGQVEPVEAMRPINLAGGGISIAGTREGTQAIATVTVNPLALAAAEDPVAQRLLDLSVTAPFKLQQSNADTSRFVGLRMRTNVTALWNGAALREALQRFYVAAGKFADDLSASLREAKDLHACVQSVLNTRRVAREACGFENGQAALDVLRTRSRAALSDARREADRYYLGIDARLDLGDPTSSDTPGDEGTHLLAGLAFGARIPQGAHWDVELRGRVAYDYFHATSAPSLANDDNVISSDWGAAIVLQGRASTTTEKQRLAFGIGAEGRHAKGGVVADATETNFVDLNLMAIVPTTSGSDMGLRVRIPLNDSHTPRGTLVTFSTDLGLLDGSSTAARKDTVRE